uniref:Uncharacterized protein n=1 Tax=Anguilla anguilla TaxID=7936 RepID=A0A0E9T8F1_ANGAN
MHLRRTFHKTFAAVRFTARQAKGSSGKEDLLGQDRYEETLGENTPSREKLILLWLGNQ